MNRMTFGTLVLGIVACGKDEAGGDTTVTGTFATTLSGGTSTGWLHGCSDLQVAWFWSDDGADPPDGCDDTLTIDICDPLGETMWWLGMAETANLTGGWFGEDCLGGAAGYDVCHAIGAYDTIVEAPNCAPSDVTDGVTLFDASKDRGGPGDGVFLTYFIEDSLGYCFAWGDDPSYYSAVGCESLMTM